MNTAERLALIERALEELRITARGNLVLVEGKRDVQALEVLGVGGEHVKIHRGRTLQTVADRLVERAAGRRVVLLLDWDRTGGRLQERMHRTLAGRVGLDIECRRRLAMASHERCIEDIPSELAALRRLPASNKG